MEITKIGLDLLKPKLDKSAEIKAPQAAPNEDFEKLLANLEQIENGIDELVQGTNESATNAGAISSSVSKAGNLLQSMEGVMEKLSVEPTKKSAKFVAGQYEQMKNTKTNKG